MTSLNTPRAKTIALALLAMTQFIIVMDASITNVALPTIGTALKFSQSSLTWVINAYTLTFGGFLLLGGRLADLLGRRRLFVGGLILFSLASLAGGLSTNEFQLIVARGVQGLGAALVSPAALSIVTTTFKEGAERNRALGVWGAVAGAGGAAGVLLGGLLTQYLGWEWVLWVNVPIGLSAAFLAPRLLPESRDEVEHRSFDIPGALAVTAGLALLVYTIVDAESAGWTSARTFAGIGGALALIGVFVLVEARARKPLMPLSTFRLQTLRGANVVGVLTGMALFSMFFVISLYLQQVLGYSALKAGLAYLPLSSVIIISAGIASQVVTRVGFKPTLILGSLLTAAGLLWFTQIPVHGSFAVNVLGPSIVAGAGLGFSFVPVTIAAVTGTRPDQAGLASGLINTSQQVGGALGVAILASVASSVSGAINPRGHLDPSQLGNLTDGFRSAFLVGAGFAVVAALAAGLLISTRDSKHMAAAARAGEPIPAAA